MSDRSCTWDLRVGLGLYRWGDDRPAVQEVFPDAGYEVYGNVYAFQRVFGVEGLFGAGAVAFTTASPSAAGISSRITSTKRRSFGA